MSLKARLTEIYGVPEFPVIFGYNLFWKTSLAVERCYICANKIPRKRRYIQAYSHNMSHAFLSLINLCKKCGTEIAELNKQSIKELK